MSLSFVTSNAAKFALAQKRLSRYKIEIAQTNLELEENQNLQVEDVARYKAMQVFQKQDDPFFVEDSGFYIEALNGFPGAFLSATFELLGDTRLAMMMKNEENKRAYIKSVLLYGEPKTKALKTFTGICTGSIADEPRGKNLRGWKVVRIFKPDGWDKTLAELTDDEWQKFLDEFQQNDHFEQLGVWISQNNIV